MVAATPPIPEPPPAPAKPRSPLASLALSAWEFLRDRWLSIDLRTLGVFRIAFGIALIGNLYDHTKDGHLVAFFTNLGVMPNYLVLQAPIQPRPWSLLLGLSQPFEVVLAFVGILAVYVLYTVGWKTRLMQILVFVCFVSLVNRNLLLQDGGSFVSTLLAIWTAFLPVGARFSVDRWLARRRGFEDLPETPARHVSFVCLALLLQLSVIYGFNAANKTGMTWRNGTAVHYVLWLNGTNTELAGFLRYHEPRWLSPFLTRGTLAFEWAAPILALTPIFQTVARRVLIAQMLLFHLGIALIMSLGPFSYAMMAFSALLLRPDDFAWLEPRARRLARALDGFVARRPALARWRTALDEQWGAPADRPSGSGPARSAAWRPGAAWTRRLRVARLTAREGFAMLLFCAMLTELTVANAAMPKRLHIEDRPAWMSELLYYLRVYQTWGMFSADPPLDSATVVVDAVLADGSHIDPLTGKPPDFEPQRHGPWLQGHDWSEYIFYYPWDRHKAYRDGLRDYAVRQDEAWPPEKKIRSLSIYWVSAMSPAPGALEPHDFKRETLLTFTPPRH